MDYEKKKHIFALAEHFSSSHFHTKEKRSQGALNQIVLYSRFCGMIKKHQSITESYLQSGTSAATTPCSALLHHISPLPHFYHQPLVLPLCRFPSCSLLLGDRQADSSFLCVQTQNVEPQLTFYLAFKLRTVCFTCNPTVCLREYHFK